MSRFSLFSGMKEGTKKIRVRHLRLSLAVLALCASGLGNVGSVHAGTYASYSAGDGTANGNYDVAVGFGAKTNSKPVSGDGSWASTAVGYNAETYTSLSTAIGAATSAQASRSVALGVETGALGVSSTAVGANVTAVSDYSTAVGARSKANNDYSTAVGFSAFVSGYNSVALGAASVVTEADTISVGSDGTVANTTGNKLAFTRKIVNVTDGAASSDAATFGQIAKKGQTVTATVGSA